MTEGGGLAPPKTWDAVPSSGSQTTPDLLIELALWISYLFLQSDSSGRMKGEEEETISVNLWIWKYRMLKFNNSVQSYILCVKLAELPLGFSILDCKG